MAQEAKQQGSIDDREQEQHGGAQESRRQASIERPRAPTRASTTASVLGSMEGDPETSQRIGHVMDQLDEQGRDELRVLASRVATGAKRKGRIAQEDEYLAQNPWHDRSADKTLFSLGEPLPHRDDKYGERNPWHNQEKDRPVFSLGEPLPRTVRKGNHAVNAAAADMNEQEEDVEKGLRRRPTRTGQGDVDTPNTERTEETLRDNRSHKGDQDQGTDSELIPSSGLYYETLASRIPFLGSFETRFILRRNQKLTEIPLSGAKISN